MVETAKIQERDVFFAGWQRSGKQKLSQSRTHSLVDAFP